MSAALSSSVMKFLQVTTTQFKHQLGSCHLFSSTWTLMLRPTCSDWGTDLWKHSSGLLLEPSRSRPAETNNNDQQRTLWLATDWWHHAQVDIHLVVKVKFLPNVRDLFQRRFLQDDRKRQEGSREREISVFNKLYSVQLMKTLKKMDNKKCFKSVTSVLNWWVGFSFVTVYI